MSKRPKPDPRRPASQHRAEIVFAHASITRNGVTTDLTPRLEEMLLRAMPAGADVTVNGKRVKR